MGRVLRWASSSLSRTIRARASDGGSSNEHESTSERECLYATRARILPCTCEAHSPRGRASAPAACVQMGAPRGRRRLMWDVRWDVNLMCAAAAVAGNTRTPPTLCRQSPLCPAALGAHGTAHLAVAGWHPPRRPAASAPAQAAQASRAPAVRREARGRAGHARAGPSQAPRGGGKAPTGSSRAARRLRSERSRAGHAAGGRPPSSVMMSTVVEQFLDASGRSTTAIWLAI